MQPRTDGKTVCIQRVGDFAGIEACVDEAGQADAGRIRMAEQTDIGRVQQMIAQTLTQSGANNAALGDVRPENTSAIIAVREAATMPLQMLKLNNSTSMDIFVMSSNSALLPMVLASFATFLFITKTL